MSNETPISNKQAFLRMVVVAISAGLVMSLTYLPPVELPYDIPVVWFELDADEKSHIALQDFRRLDLTGYQPWSSGMSDDEIITDHLKEKFHTDHKIDISKNAKSMRRLRKAAKKARIELSSQTETVVDIRSLAVLASGPIHLNVRLSVTQLDAIRNDIGDSAEADRLPFAQWFGGKTDGNIPSPDFAGYSKLNDEEVSAESAANTVSKELANEAGSSNKDEEEDERAEEALVAPPKEINQSLVVTSPTTNEVNTPLKQRIVIDPGEYAGLSVDISDPSGDGMRHFYESLERTALQEPNSITRISHWGASVLGADGLTSTARKKLQTLFGSAGRGWVNAAGGSQWYRPKDVIYKESGWIGKSVARGQLTPGLYGYGGVAGLGVGWKGSWASYIVHANKLELYYRARKKGGTIAITVDGKEPVLVNTATENEEDRFFSTQVEGDGEHTFKIKATGKKRVQVYGVTLETDGPGVVYDCIAMIGTRSSRLLNYDKEHIKGQIAHRKPDLMILMYGGNEASDIGMNMAVYKEKYRSAIQTMRAARPEASCLIMSPTDHRERYRGRHITSRTLKKIMTVQRELATELDCAYFDMWSAMGGEGSITKWRKNRWASGDYIHMTKAGNRVLGAIVYKALVKGFANFLKKQDPIEKLAPQPKAPDPTPPPVTPEAANETHPPTPPADSSGDAAEPSAEVPDFPNHP